MLRRPILPIVLSALAIHCGSSSTPAPTTTTDGGTTPVDTGGGAVMPCQHESDGSLYDCQTCTANCQFLKDWCKDGKLVTTCPTEKAVGTCKNADPVGIGTTLDVVYYEHPKLTGGKPQCDILKGTWTPK